MIGEDAAAARPSILAVIRPCYHGAPIRAVRSEGL